MIDLFQILRNRPADELWRELQTKNINTVNKYGHRLLTQAITYKKDEIAFELIKRGIDVNMQDEDGISALHCAAERRRGDVIDAILLHGGDVTAEDVHGNQALWTAVFNFRENFRSIESLLRAGADPWHKNKHGTSPLDMTVNTCNKAVEQMLRDGVQATVKRSKTRRQGELF